MTTPQNKKRKRSDETDFLELKTFEVASRKREIMKSILRIEKYSEVIREEEKKLKNLLKNENDRRFANSLLWEVAPRIRNKTRIEKEDLENSEEKEEKRLPSNVSPLKIKSFKEKTEEAKEKKIKKFPESQKRKQKEEKDRILELAKVLKLEEEDIERFSKEIDNLNHQVRETFRKYGQSDLLKRKKEERDSALKRMKNEILLEEEKDSDPPKDS